MGDLMIESIVFQEEKGTIQAVDKICHRCLGEDCFRGEDGHIYCLSCTEQLMSDFVYLKRVERKTYRKQHRLELNFSLNTFQEKGSHFIETCFRKGRKGYLHAVCGAGKTEMCLESILLALNQEKRVVFVIPRVEIIKQLVKRFKSYFPKTRISGLYQDCEFDVAADLFVSTPQQLIRFYQEFDLVIIDEADAFPFFKNLRLERLIHKAKKMSGVLIYISATLPNYYRRMIINKELEYCLIPARFHQKPMVVPCFARYHHLYSKHILKSLKNYQRIERPCLVFFPSIQLMYAYHQYLLSNNIEHQYISSKARDKQSLINAFEKGRCFVLLTTTLLERGVTFKGCDCLVMESDHRIFDRDTLIQIAGRVGRDKDASQGKLVFYSRLVTSAMIEAKQEIKRMNRMV